MNDIPRRVRIDQSTDVELAIRAVVTAIEAMPADVRLTDAQNFLHRAREKVADYVDGVTTPDPYAAALTAAAERETTLREEVALLNRALDSRMRSGIEMLEGRAKAEAEVERLKAEARMFPWEKVGKFDRGESAERQKVQELLEWLDIEIAKRVGRTGRGTWEHGVVNGARAVRSKLLALGLTPDPPREK